MNKIIKFDSNKDLALVRARARKRQRKRRKKLTQKGFKQVTAVLDPETFEILKILTEKKRLTKGQVIISSLRNYYLSMRWGMLKGSRLDWERYQRAISERWEKSDRLTHCTIHDTYFDPEVEPCWQCYNEFEKEL